MGTLDQEVKGNGGGRNDEVLPTLISLLGPCVDLVSCMLHRFLSFSFSPFINSLPHQIFAYVAS